MSLQIQIYYTFYITRIFLNTNILHVLYNTCLCKYEYITCFLTRVFANTNILHVFYYTRLCKYKYQRLTLGIQWNASHFLEHNSMHVLASVRLDTNVRSCITVYKRYWEERHIAQRIRQATLVCVTIHVFRKNNIVNFNHSVAIFVYVWTILSMVAV